jgi:long-chain fatty acid transport protein
MGKIDATAVAFLAIAFPVAASANGYQDLHQSADGMATAYATNGAGGDDISAAFSNPASLSRMTGVSVVNGTSLIMPRDTFSNLSALSWGEEVVGTPETPTQFLDNSVGNAFYLGWQLDESWTFGLSLNAPWATVSKYPASAVSRYFAVDTNLLALTATPTVAYKINSNWSVGLGVNLQYYSAEFSTAIDSDASGASDADLLSTVSGTDFGVGFTLGIEGTIGRTRVGLSHRSKIDHGFDGAVDLTGGDTDALETFLSAFVAGPISRNGSAAFDIATPSITTLGISHRVNDRVELYGSAMKVGWSAFADTVVTYSNGLPETRVPNGWNDKTYVAVGGGYQATENLKLRAGIALDRTPTPDNVRNPRAPNADRIYTGLGFSYDVSDSFEVSGSWAHTFFDTAPIALDYGYGNELYGDIDVDADIFMLQIAKRW